MGAKPVTIYGIKNCDTMKKARAWLDAHHVAYVFHDKKAIALMLAQPSMIKRPVLDAGGKLLVGFKPEQYEKAFGARR